MLTLASRHSKIFGCQWLLLQEKPIRYVLSRLTVRYYSLRVLVFRSCAQIALEALVKSRLTLNWVVNNSQSSSKLVKRVCTHTALGTIDTDIIPGKHRSCHVSLHMIISRADLHSKLTFQQAWRMYLAHVIQSLQQYDHASRGRMQRNGNRRLICKLELYATCLDHLNTDRTTRIPHPTLSFTS